MEDSFLTQYWPTIVEFFETKTGFAIGLVSILAYMFIWSRVFSKAGYPSAWGIVAILPPAWLVFPVFLAFGHWPSLKEMRELRRVQRAVHRADDRFSRVA